MRLTENALKNRECICEGNVNFRGMTGPGGKKGPCPLALCAKTHYNNTIVFAQTHTESVDDMKKITVQQAAEKWGLSVRYVQSMCKGGKIPGAERFGLNWMIPEDAERPPDGRSKAGKAARTAPPAGPSLPRKCPYLDMTDLYHTPGTADRCVEALADWPEAQALFAAEIAYSRGQIDKVYEQARFFLDSRSGLYAVIGGSMLLGLVAMWRGDLRLWNEAHRHMYEAPCKDEKDRGIVELAFAATDSAIRDTDEFPEWFARGCFDNLPRDSHPAARVYYIKHLLIAAQELAQGNLEMEGVKGMGMMKLLPYIMEPMISQMVADKIIMAEIYLRLSCAIAYRQAGNDNFAAEHLDKAIRLCLPDRLYGPLVEHRRQLGPFLDDRLAMIDPEALKTVKMLHKQLMAGWTKLHNAVLDRSVQVRLTGREREVARLASFGMTDSQIAAQLRLSESSVKAAIRTAKNKTGVNTRGELAVYV